MFAVTAVAVDKAVVEEDLPLEPGAHHHQGSVTGLGPGTASAPVVSATRKDNAGAGPGPVPERWHRCVYGP